MVRGRGRSVFRGSGTVYGVDRDQRILRRIVAIIRTIHAGPVVICMA